MNSHQNIVIVCLVLFGAIAIVTSILTYRIFMYVGNNKKTEDEALLAKERLLNKRFSNYSLQQMYDELKLFLSQYGVSYIFNHDVTPQGYIAFKISVSALAGLLFFWMQGFTFRNIGITVLIMIFVFWWQDHLIRSNNKSGNDKMLSDIKTIYSTLTIQSTSGVFLTDALEECYRQVKFRRLKKALKILTNTIATKHDVEGALDEFGIKFKNQYIDTLCTTLKQSLQSGQSRELLKDISGQLSDVTHAMSIKEQAKMDNVLSIMQVLVFTVLMAIIFFIATSGISDSIFSMQTI